MSLKKSKLFQSVFSVSGVLLLSKLMGFAKQMVTAGTFGATMETDLISLSQTFIGNIQYVLVQTLLTAFVAVYIHLRERDEGEAQGFAVAAGKAFTLLAALIAAVVILFAPAIARIIAPSYSAEVSARLANYLRLFAPALLLFVWIAVFHALLDANQRFVPGQLEGMNQSLILLAMIWLLEPRLGVHTLIAAFFVYTVWNALFLGGMSRRYWRNYPGNPFHSPAVRELLRMVGPLLLGYAMVYINEQVDKILSSGLAVGTVTAMGYAAVLSNLVSTFEGAFCSILFTYITKHISRGDDRSAAALTRNSALLLGIAFLPISILTVSYAEEIVTIAFGRGAFGADSVAIAAAALRGYGLMFVPLVLRELFSRLQYGYQNTKTPMVNSSIGIAANIVLSIALCPVLGVFGITAASSVSVLICGVLNVITARCHNAFLAVPIHWLRLSWIALGGVGCGVSAIWCGKLLAESAPILRFFGATVCGGGVYLVVLLPLLRKILREVQNEKER